MDPSGALTHVAGAGEPAPPGVGPRRRRPGDGRRLRGVIGLAVDGGSLYLSRPAPAGSGGSTPPESSPRWPATGSTTPAATAGQAGAPSSPTARSPSGPTGTYVVCDVTTADTGRIRRIDPAGVVSTIYEGPVHGMAVDDAGNVFLSVTHRSNGSPRGHHLDRRRDRRGGLRRRRWTGRPGPPSCPRALAVDGAGNVYIADYGNLRIRRIDPVGNIVTHVAGRHARDRGSSSPATAACHRRPGRRPRGIPLLERGWQQLRGDPQGRPAASSARSGSAARTAVCRRLRRLGLLHRRQRGPPGRGRRHPVDGGRLRRFGAVRGRAGDLGRAPSPTGLAIHPSGRLLFGDQGRVLQVDGVTGGRAAPGPPCATPPDRPLWGTGYNAHGQLGDGTTTGRDSSPRARTPR